MFFSMWKISGQSVWQSTMTKNCCPPYVQKSIAISWKGRVGRGLVRSGSRAWDGGFLDNASGAGSSCCVEVRYVCGLAGGLA